MEFGPSHYFISYTPPSSLIFASSSSPPPPPSLFSSLLPSLFHRRQDPNLWVQALSYFASRQECKAKILDVLRHIEENHLMPPLMVVQTLAESQYATLSDIKVREESSKQSLPANFITELVDSYM